MVSDSARGGQLGGRPWSVWPARRGQFGRRTVVNWLAESTEGQLAAGSVALAETLSKGLAGERPF